MIQNMRSQQVFCQVFRKLDKIQILIHPEAAVTMSRVVHLKNGWLVLGGVAGPGPVETVTMLYDHFTTFNESSATATAAMPATVRAIGTPHQPR